MYVIRKQFINQDQVDEAKREMLAVFPRKKIGNLGIVGDKCTYVGFSVRKKGNEPSIRKLEELGWHRKPGIKEETFWNCASAYVELVKDFN